MSQQRPPYQKPWLSYADQVAQLIARGLTITDSAAAEQFLSHINYFRFSGYCLAFEQHPHAFRPGVTFEQVRASYDFDLALRDLVTEALEMIEVDMRTAIAYYFGQKYGAFGHVDPANFFRTFDHQGWLSRLRDETGRSSESFVTHFRNSHSQFPDLPIWMLTETVSFGGLSKMFQGMLNADKRGQSCSSLRPPASRVAKLDASLGVCTKLCGPPFAALGSGFVNYPRCCLGGRVWHPLHLPGASPASQHC